MEFKKWGSWTFLLFNHLIRRKGTVFHFKKMFMYISNILGSFSKQLVMRRDGTRREGACCERYGGTTRELDKILMSFSSQKCDS